MKKLTVIVIMMLFSLALASSALAIDFGLSCPDTVTSDAPFECEVKMPTPAIQPGLLGLSFTITTDATVNSVTFPQGNDASDLPTKTYAFFTTAPISAPGTVIAKISLTKHSSGSVTIKGIKASLENKIKKSGSDLAFPTETFTVVEDTTTCPANIKQEPITSSLLEGTVGNYCFKGIKYQIQLIYVDDDEAKFKVNGADTAKLKVNAEEAFSDDKAKIVVDSIVYQAYAAGVHSADFTIKANDATETIGQRIDSTLGDKKSTKSWSIDIVSTIAKALKDWFGGK